MLCHPSCRHSLAVLCLALLAVLPACGNDRNTPASAAVAEPSSKQRRLRYPAAGLSLEVPQNMRVERASAPGVLRATFDQALLSVFAYRRSEPLPRGQAELEQALERLERAARTRSDGYRLRDSRMTEVGGAPAVELLGDQTISGAALRTRSLHVYEGSAEYVVELLVPVRRFRRLDRALFPDIRGSLELTGVVRRGKSRDG